jgi:hypothetical protein
MSDSDLVLCQCGHEWWVHDHRVEAGGPCPKCGVRWTEQEVPRVRGAAEVLPTEPDSPVRRRARPISADGRARRAIAPLQAATPTDAPKVGPVLVQPPLGGHVEQHRPVASTGCCGRPPASTPRLEFWHTPPIARVRSRDIDSITGR